MGTGCLSVQSEVILSCVRMKGCRDEQFAVLIHPCHIQRVGGKYSNHFGGEELQTWSSPTKIFVSTGFYRKMSFSHTENL